MSRLTRDGTAEPVSRDQIRRHARGQGNIIFPVQLTTSRIGNLTRLIHTLLYVMTVHTYIHTVKKGGSYGNKILYKNIDLTQDFPNKISFHFLSVKMLPKNLPRIFRWPEMCPLGDKILAQDFQMAALTKILGRRDKSVVPLLSTENCKTLFYQKLTQHMYGGDCDAAIAKAAAAVTHVQSQSQ